MPGRRTSARPWTRLAVWAAPSNNGHTFSKPQAAKLAPERSRYTYVWAVALHSAGRSKEAVAALREADKRHPYDAAILGTLISIDRETGDTVAALGHARKLAEVLPDDPQVKAMVAELTRGR